MQIKSYCLEISILVQLIEWLMGSILIESGDPWLMGSMVIESGDPWLMGSIMIESGDA